MQGELELGFGKRKILDSDGRQDIWTRSPCGQMLGCGNKQGCVDDRES